MGRPHSPQSGENDDGDGLFVTRLHFTVSHHGDKSKRAKSQSKCMLLFLPHFGMPGFGVSRVGRVGNLVDIPN